MFLLFHIQYGQYSTQAPLKPSPNYCKRCYSCKHSSFMTFFFSICWHHCYCLCPNQPECVSGVCYLRSVHMSVCLYMSTNSNLYCNFWNIQGIVFTFGKIILWVKHFQMITLATLWLLPFLRMTMSGPRCFINTSFFCSQCIFSEFSHMGIKHSNVSRVVTLFHHLHSNLHNTKFPKLSKHYHFYSNLDEACINDHGFS